MLYPPGVPGYLSNLLTEAVVGRTIFLALSSAEFLFLPPYRAWCREDHSPCPGHLYNLLTEPSGRGDLVLFPGHPSCRLIEPVVGRTIARVLSPRRFPGRLSYRLTKSVVRRNIVFVGSPPGAPGHLSYLLTEPVVGRTVVLHFPLLVLLAVLPPYRAG